MAQPATAAKVAVVTAAVMAAIAAARWAATAMVAEEAVEVEVAAWQAAA